MAGLDTVSAVDIPRLRCRQVRLEDLIEDPNICYRIVTLLCRQVVLLR